ncbi:MAG: penicillin-binding protein 2 [Cyanobacteria bacterium P01_H01_bin.15]
MITLSPRTRSRRRSSERSIGRSWRFACLLLAVSTMLGGIGYRLYQLQILDGTKNSIKATHNHTRVMPKPPVRGNIFDRKGRVLASTRLSHAAYIWPKVQMREEWPQMRRRLALILEQPEAELQALMEQAGYNSPTLVTLSKHLTPEQIIAIAEFSAELPGLEVDVATLRNYPNGEIGSHLLGYTGELNAEELEAKRKDGYRLGDYMGKMGVEATLEPLLRGEWGGIMLKVDGAGRVLDIMGQKKAQAGGDVTLTLDLELQKAAEAALGEQKGALVALDPQTGAILAMASYPRFDPNIFSGPISEETWRKLQAKGNPFLNRALRGYPPASTFKMVTATAGMESGKYPAHVILGTSAYLNVGGTRVHDWNRAGFGAIGYRKALAWSSNTFFGQIGRGVGGSALIDWSRRYGFGAKTEVELTGETPGLIADDAWKKERFQGNGWSDGDTVNMSIGQGFTLATPLQVAVMFAVPANGGYRVQPHLLQNSEKALAAKTSLDLNPSTLSMLQEGLRAVVDGGTGGALNVPHLPPSAGKSGTAEAPIKNHAWFGAYAPFDNPEVVVVGFAEHSGGGGGSVAAPKVKTFLEAYFGQKQDP